MIATMTARIVVVAVALLAAASCGVEQPEECARYVACQAAFDEAFGIVPATIVSDYDEGGSCWHGNLETADACTRNCASANESLAEAASSAGQPLDACQDG